MTTHLDDSCPCGALHSTPCTQTLDEIDFERGIWSAARDGELERAETLLNRGVDPNQRDSAGYTALHYGSRNGRVLVCELLLRRGAFCDAKTPSGASTPLHRASFCGHANVVELLLKYKANVLAQDSDGQTSLHKAASGGHCRVIRLLVDTSPRSKDVQDNRGRKAIDFCAPDNAEIRDLLS